MSTVEVINALYTKNVAALNKYCNDMILQIQKSLLRLAMKNQRIQAVKNFYNQTLKAIKKKRDDDLKLATTGNYKALLVGINYKGTSYELKGCINDVQNITQYLVSQNISADKMCILTDDTDIKPTKNNIINYFTKLLTDAKSGDQLVFFYSGHGSTIVNTSINKDVEPFDDVLITIDSNCIIDDDLNEIIQKNLKPNVKLFVLFDCCHSGTMLDLRYNFPVDDTKPGIIIDNSSENTKSNVFYISGCKDDQTSMETFINSKTQGALTWAFLEAVKQNNNNMSWKMLVKTIRDNLKKYQFIQIPQFSSGLSCDVNSLWSFSK
jgi:hypothetical protein